MPSHNDTSNYTNGWRKCKDAVQGSGLVFGLSLLGRYRNATVQALAGLVETPWNDVLEPPC